MEITYYTHMKNAYQIMIPINSLSGIDLVMVFAVPTAMDITKFFGVEKNWKVIKNFGCSMKWNLRVPASCVSLM